jgi:hypothetical protein
MDPVKRIGELAAADPEREEVAELFEAWSRRHGEAATYCKKLHPEVLKIIDPDKRGYQRVTNYLGNLAGTRLAGYLLKRDKDETRPWISATYTLKRTIREIDL